MSHLETRPRALALNILEEVVRRKTHLDQKLRSETVGLNARDTALVAELCFGVCRFYAELRILVLLVATAPLKDLEVELGLLLGFYEIKYTRIPAYATVNEITALIGERRPAAKSMVNACLRRYDRLVRAGKLAPTDLQARYAHPRWIIAKIAHDFPRDWQAILTANNGRSPFGLRVNAHRTRLADYTTFLDKEGIQYRLPAVPALAPDALILEGRYQTAALPRYPEGWICVQDVGAQLAAGLLIPQQGENILDACCAPGNKLSHGLITAAAIPAVHYLGLDKNPKRLAETRLNLARQGFSEDQAFQLRVADLNAFAKRRANQARYAKILLDVPCSASGVIRRHPDIKLRLAASNITGLVREQANLLQSAWRCLRPGGHLLYSSCSLFADENENLITAFLDDQSDARCLAPPARLRAVETIRWRQSGMFYLLPGQDHDGFFYARLIKQET